MARDRLLPIDKDTNSLSDAVFTRLQDLEHSWMRIKGVALPIPVDIDKAILKWGDMIERLAKNDFRYKESELKALQEVAQWSVNMNCTLRNQPLKKIKWK